MLNATGRDNVDFDGVWVHVYAYAKMCTYVFEYNHATQELSLLFAGFLFINIAIAL